LGSIGLIRLSTVSKTRTGTKTIHKTRFPGESSEYRAARDELLRLEVELRRQTEAVAARRRMLPEGGEVTQDYVFKMWSPKTDAITSVRFSELFAPGKDTLFLYNFMYPESLESSKPCPSCTSIIDGVDGAARHVAHRINFVAVAKAPIAKFRDHAKRRGWWHTTLLSASGNTFKRDYHAESLQGEQWPLAQVFVRRRGKVHHFWSSELWSADADRGQDKRHVDFMWPVWSLLDTTPDGRGEDFYPSLRY